MELCIVDLIIHLEKRRRNKRGKIVCLIWTSGLAFGRARSFVSVCLTACVSKHIMACKCTEEGR